ncbi:VanZ family protein [Ihubacter sp. mB4P-1]|uniref:VanZ family protein n=1 Tax=Ihubacter sp. mB4P-1 TaxID=3242370 RepID=UPI003C7E7679
MNFKKVLTIIITSIVLGYLMHYYVFCELLTRFVSTNNLLYFPAMWFSLFFCITCFAILAVILLQHKISKYLYYTLITLYILLLVIAIFGRSAMQTVFVWNPMDSIFDLRDPEMKLQSLLNFLCFIPMGYFFRRLKLSFVFCGATVLAFFLEIVQALTARGIFDTFDIILYVAGICVGYGISRLLKLELLVESGKNQKDL